MIHGLKPTDETGGPQAMMTRPAPPRHDEPPIQRRTQPDHRPDAGTHHRQAPVQRMIHGPFPKRPIAFARDTITAALIFHDGEIVRFPAPGCISLMTD